MSRVMHCFSLSNSFPMIRIHILPIVAGTGCFLRQLPSEISHLSKLVSLNLGNNPEVKLETRILEGLVRNLTMLEQLDLDSVDMSAMTLGSMANLSNSLISLSLSSCGLQGNFPENIFFLPNLRTLKLAYNQNLTGFFPKENWSNPLQVFGCLFHEFLRNIAT
ncbi:hypothetical protein EZV62_002324 [Acer yangbiense]|uniref:Leucine-rich repeat-containing N-terminal plant-type domain-containing protein n=1 Tax=Acer yangbiense TaxID=1000413 RepID=A0A5C7IWY7_9ROSI|nr:hypothetical protein EZV62_002324 [Acer yangbiense]